MSGDINQATAFWNFHTPIRMGHIDKMSIARTEAGTVGFAIRHQAPIFAGDNVMSERLCPVFLR